MSSTLSIVGEWWTLLILHDAFDGFSRFDEFQQSIGLSSSMLSKRLATLVDSGIFEKHPYSNHPVRYEYRLTELGRSLRPVVISLAAWTNARLPSEHRTMILVDRSGREMEPVVVDSASGRRLDDADEFRYTAGPAAGPGMRARYAGSAPNSVQERSAR